MYDTVSNAFAFHQKALVRICQKKHDGETRNKDDNFLAKAAAISPISREGFPVKISFAVEMLTRKYVN